MTVHVYTSFSFSYLDRARVFAASLKSHHEDWVLWAVLTDKSPAGYFFDFARDGFDRLLTAEDLYGADTDQWLFGHDVVEACTAVKGRAMLHIMRDPTTDCVLYFDPDIAIFNSLEPIVAMLEKSAIVLTPHQVHPEPREDRVAVRDNEVTSLGFGVYNLGFVAVNTSGEAWRFAEWWAARLDEWCHDRRDIGIFVDQKWCDLVPCFFEDVKILRDPGYNLASWNLSHRKLKFDKEGRALVNSHLLRFYHFTKLGPVGDVMTQRYAKDNVEIYELWWWYREQIKRSIDPGIPAGWWHYGYFDNGKKIDKTVRELYRERQDLRRAFPNPRFVANGLYAWLVANNYIEHVDDAA